jgi:hypothetical protein
MYQHLEVNFTDNNATYQGDGSSGNWGGGSRGVLIENRSSTTGSKSLIQFRSNSNDYFIGTEKTSSGSQVIFKRENDDPDLTIDSSGNVLIGKTSVSQSTVGTQMLAGGATEITTNDNRGLLINRKNNDGQLVAFDQDGTTEGSISVSGSTVSYNGAHLARWSQLPGGAERTEILRGSVLSNLDEMCEWGEEDNEQLNRMKVSDTEGDKNVSGVFQAWDDDDDTYLNDFYCAMTGDFVIRIAQGTTVARGDLLMSAGDGTAKPQDDDIVRSKTIAKVTSTTVSETYSDGSYCVPCVLMAC